MYAMIYYGQIYIHKSPTVQSWEIYSIGGEHCVALLLFVFKTKSA